MRPFIIQSLTKGQVVFYDLEDLALIAQYAWRPKWNKGTKSYYAQANFENGTKRSTVQMSRLIVGLNIGDKRQVDHINHDTLDNRKENLRIVTNTQNTQNRRNVKGYSWNKSVEKWQARIMIQYKLIHIGYYNTEAEAQQAYLIARQNNGFISRA